MMLVAMSRRTPTFATEGRRRHARRTAPCCRPGSRPWPRPRRRSPPWSSTASVWRGGWRQPVLAPGRATRSARRMARSAPRAPSRTSRAGRACGGRRRWPRVGAASASSGAPRGRRPSSTSRALALCPESPGSRPAIPRPAAAAPECALAADREPLRLPRAAAETAGAGGVRARPLGAFLTFYAARSNLDARFAAGPDFRAAGPRSGRHTGRRGAIFQVSVEPECLPRFDLCFAVVVSSRHGCQRGAFRLR
mmetsp:Transcript_38458/g.110928  ORF Transcript_38458/g.110928 Transcript_38458/m.110928 type:complete len:251 (-) Transcript_38458:7-759(-)